MKKLRTILYVCTLLLITACSDETVSELVPSVVDDAQVIHVGGVSTNGLITDAVITRDGENSGDTSEEGSPDSEIQKDDAENVPWLLDPLKQGLDITYFKTESTKNIAKLKLMFKDTGKTIIDYSEDGDDKYAKYSFNQLDDTGAESTNPAIPAKWLDNGAHYFQGVYVPERIKTGVTGFPYTLTTDQHEDGTTVGSEGNYTLLSRYLAMPPNFTLNATVARVKLPFRHRLARVLAYILIDPALGSGVTLEGYNYQPAKAAEGDNPATAEVPDNPTSTKISFSNVEVLQSVTETTESGVTKYTPVWTKPRKVVPHFVGERGSYNDSINDYMRNEKEHFIAFYNEDKGTYIYPTNAPWENIYNAWVTDKTKTEITYNSVKYKITKYGTVPVYDVIVRPTYSSRNRVMYDEAGTTEALYAKTNQIDFELSLSNGLHYTKKFIFDLDANYQTVVYLHISRERVDYNSSGSDLWIETLGSDDYYGVNNQNGNTLSYAGNSWQRAYTNVGTGSDAHPNPFTDKVTDGHFYTGDSEDEFAQYVSDAKWIEMFIEAYEGGRHHGDYFILHNDISIPAAAFPAGFVFTGHLDGQDHTITITGDSYTKRTYYGTDVSEETLPGKTSDYYLFSGLNGKYSTAQESGGTADWEANVHLENGKWVPYRQPGTESGTYKDGWRAEMINTNFAIATENNCSVFRASAVWGTDVTGYLHNCWINGTCAAPTEGAAKKWTGTRITDYTPDIPDYK